MFNGMLFQTNPPQVFDASWPAGWHWADMQPYFSRVRSKVPVTNTPSTDGVAAKHRPGDDRASAVRQAPAGSKATPASRSPCRASTAGPMSLPTDGHRAGPISGYFEGVDPGGMPVSGLEILQLLQGRPYRLRYVRQRRLAVHYTKRGGLDQSQPGTSGTARLRSRRTAGDGGGRAGHSAAVAAERRRSAGSRGGDLSRSIAGPICDRQRAWSASACSTMS